MEMIVIIDQAYKLLLGIYPLVKEHPVLIGDVALDDRGILIGIFQDLMGLVLLAQLHIGHPDPIHLYRDEIDLVLDIKIHGLAEILYRLFQISHVEIG